MKTKTPQLKSNRKHQPRRRVKSERPQPPNSAHYHFENGKHVFTLELCEGAFMATKTVGQLFGGPEGRARTTADHVLAMLLDSVEADLTQVGEDEAKAILTRIETEETTLATQRIVLDLPIKAHTILAGQAAAKGYDSVKHLILHDTASLCGQDAGGNAEDKEYFEMFGLVVEANGDTRLP